MNERYEKGIEALRNESVDPSVKARLRAKLAGEHRATWAWRLAFATGAAGMAAGIFLMIPQRSDAAMLQELIQRTKKEELNTIRVMGPDGRISTVALSGYAQEQNVGRSYFTKNYIFEEYEDYFIKESRAPVGWTIFSNLDLGKTKNLKATDVKNGIMFDFIYIDPKSSKPSRYLIRTDKNKKLIVFVSVMVQPLAKLPPQAIEGKEPVFGDKKVYDLDFQRNELWAGVTGSLARARVGNREVALVGLVTDRKGEMLAILSGAKSVQSGVIADGKAGSPSESPMGKAFKLGKRDCVAVAVKFDQQLGKVADLIIPVDNDVARFRDVTPIETASVRRLVWPQNRPFWQIMSPWQKLPK